MMIIHSHTSLCSHFLVPSVSAASRVAALCPPDSQFPWRQVRPSASNDDMKRWTTALHSLHRRTQTMTSPAVTARTAVTASTPLLALHLPVSANGRHVLQPLEFITSLCVLTSQNVSTFVPLFSHLHPQTPQAVTGRQAGTVRCGDGVLLPPAAGIHQRAQPGGQLPGHGPPSLLHQTLHAGRVRPRAGDEPPAHFTPAPAPREAQCPQDEGRVHF